MEKIRIIIVDSNELFRASLIYALKKYKEIEIINVASSGIESLNKVRKLMPDVMLMEAKIDCKDIINTAQISREIFPKMKIIAVTFRNDNEIISRLLKEGVNGIVFKDTSVKEISKAILKIGKNGEYIPNDNNGQKTI